ncbi:AEC family transporter [Paenibacillus solisilvae]|uniref:AEC family transporter n=1 Tax=Paenibacillus solisilvae TaxID=2486751 RepID=A0ABW0W562_9BACL
MGNYWNVLLEVVLPIFMTCLCGILIQKWRRIDIQSLADVSLYILAPCLVLVSLAESKHNTANIKAIILFTLLHTLICWAAALLTSYLLRFKEESKATLSLTTIFGNANNYGLPILLLAYGADGFSQGINYVIMQIILVNTLGLYIASRAKVSTRQALLQIGKTPLLYSVLVGVVIFVSHIAIPKGIANGLHLMGNAYAAVVILILGVQLRNISLNGIKRWEVWVAVGLRVVIVPILSMLCIALLGIKGLLASVLLVQSSMPAAINTSVLVTKYGGDKELVTLTVAITTIISFVTLPYYINMN